MERDEFEQQSDLFPYPREVHADGSINYGGIDLTKETERIHEIPEAQASANLQRLLEEVNLQEGLFMTLGCDYGALENGIGGYIDFAFRPGVSPRIKQQTAALDDFFYAYLAKQEIQHGIADGSMVNYARGVLTWRHAPLTIGAQQYDRVILHFYCQQQDDCEWCLDHIRHFLVTAFPALPQSDV
ncbi:hypothetical protein PMPD1_1872 [Paramixta manurensis]|uniref:Uncharacterized protein n=1 Tax=Paramixta manurensis TaxID=2740817 RepID=A0A6M8UJ10_9GAMM|nr:hypothetical protein PMPD1_1872 [Erwiniaceae bacterium PD-1]